MPFLQIDGVRLYWKRDGLDHAPGLVLLNSIGTDMDLWEPVLGESEQELRHPASRCPRAWCFRRGAG
ncbi:hypothetical protein ACFSTD_22270 [Novosphingobium colocasiae]